LGRTTLHLHINACFLLDVYLKNPKETADGR